MNGLAANIELARAGVEVALLDTDGVIVEVNEAWTRFAVANGGDPARTGVGVSYLAVCEATEDDEVALSVAAAVRQRSAETCLLPCGSGSPVTPPMSRVSSTSWSPRG